MPHSVQCPQCDKAVTINDRDGGTRVNCPHCNNSFVAPGVSATESDDDDWLRLDDDFADTVEPVPSSAPSPLSHSDAEPEFGEDSGFGSDGQEEDLFGDLPPVEIPPTAPSGPALVSSATPDNDMPGLGPPVKTPPPTANSIELETEFRINCQVCGSMLYAKAEQEGKTIKCSDCFSSVPVPAPPKKRKGPDIDVENAETFSFEAPPTDNRREDPFRQSADELLQKAEHAEETEPEKKSIDFDTPDILAWARKVFGIFTDLGVMVRWILLSVIASAPAYLALSWEHQILKLGLFVGGALFAAAVIACGFAILQSVANNESSVQEWPSMDPLEWLGQSWVAFAAIGFAGVPALALSQFVFDNSLIIIALTMFSIYMMFPFVLLSMLDMQTITMPFSPEVARSVSSSQESWGGFYLSAGLLFFGLFLFFVATSGMDAPPAAVINIIATVGVAFTYFALIGRLAYSIGQSVNDSPRENDIDEIRANEKQA